ASPVEPAHRLTTSVVEVEKAHVIAAPAFDMPTDHAADEGNVVCNRVVCAALTLDPDVLNVAADTRKIGTDLEEQTAVWITRMISRVVCYCRSNRGCQSGALGLLH